MTPRLINLISREINRQAMDSQLVQILREQHNFKTPEARAFLALSEAVSKSGEAITPAEIKESTGFRGDISLLLDFASNEGCVANSGEAYSLTDPGRQFLDRLRGDTSEEL